MNDFRKRLVATAMAAFCATILSGCGGGGAASSGGGSNPPSTISVTVMPNPASVTIGGTLQFSATVAGSNISDRTVAWAISSPSGSSASPGTITSAGLYTTPYPAPAAVTVTATSNQDRTVSGSVTVTLNAPVAAVGPALSVDVANQTHAISPYIYGMNAFSMSSSTGKQSGMTINRWGGDATSRYNFKLDVTSSASDWYFENNGAANPSNGAFDQQVASDAAIGSKTIGTVPVLGWVAKDNFSCSFTSSAYPVQVGFDPYKSSCGNGSYPQGTKGCTSASGCNITGNNAIDTSVAIDGAQWASEWVTHLVGKFGTAASGGVAVYDLDNEPAWWDAVHRDVHPAPSTYDEVTINGIAVAKAIKAVDPTAEVSGPVIDNWWNYFYSKKDMESGWGQGPCYAPWAKPADRDGHGGVPMIEYYLQQFAAAEKSSGKRLLDYLDLHTYFAATFADASHLDKSNPSNHSVGFNIAGDTTAQRARLDSTRVFWDPTYTDQNYPQPNYKGDPNFHGSDCNVAPQAPRLIPMMKEWINADYPDTKTAITEYNWGGQEHINGALAQAEILGIFGREGLDIGALWGAPDPVKQMPGLIAFEMFRNYDGKNAAFGDVAIQSKSGDQSKLSIYGALRTRDDKVTLVVINKTYGDLSATLSISGLPLTTTSAQSFLYSNANLTAIVPQPDQTVNPSAGGAASTMSSTFPAQSITMLVLAH